MWEIQADCNFLNFGVWRSLVSRLVRDQEAMGSSPVTPTSREPRHAIHAVEVLLFLGFFLRFKSVMNTSYFLSILLKKCSCSLIKVLDTAVLFCYNTCCSARVAELADAHVWGACGFPVRVQVPSLAPKNTAVCSVFFCLKIGFFAACFYLSELGGFMIAHILSR